MLRRDRVQVGLVILGAFVLVVYPLAYRLTTDSRPTSPASSGVATSSPSIQALASASVAASRPTPRATRTASTATPPSASWLATAERHRGANGQSFDYDCPPGGVFYAVWGTDTYTDDSSVCTAAVHRGVITRERGGTVTIYIGPGQASYRSSTRHGITTMSYGPWAGSYAFEGP